MPAASGQRATGQGPAASRGATGASAAEAADALSAHVDQILAANAKMIRFSGSDYLPHWAHIGHAIHEGKLYIYSELRKRLCAVLGLKLEKRSVLACLVSAPQEAAGRQAKKLAVSGR